MAGDVVRPERMQLYRLDCELLPVLRTEAHEGKPVRFADALQRLRRAAHEQREIRSSQQGPKQGECRLVGKLQVVNQQHQRLGIGELHEQVRDFLRRQAGERGGAVAALFGEQRNEDVGEKVVGPEPLLLHAHGAEQGALAHPRSTLEDHHTTFLLGDLIEGPGDGDERRVAADDPTGFQATENCLGKDILDVHFVGAHRAASSGVLAVIQRRVGPVDETVAVRGVVGRAGDPNAEADGQGRLDVAKLERMLFGALQQLSG